jgi:hypothetical protein
VGNVDLDEFSILQRKLRYMYRHAKDPGSQPATRARARTHCGTTQQPSPRRHRAATDPCVGVPVGTQWLPLPAGQPATAPLSSAGQRRRQACRALQRSSRRRGASPTARRLRRRHRRRGPTARARLWMRRARS